MRIAGGTSGAFAANWYLAWADGSDQCVIIDPGEASAAPCREQVTALGLRPAAVLATHGHIDHIADAPALADGYGVPLHIHRADRPFLTDPASALTAELAAMLKAYFPGPFREPSSVQPYDVNPKTGRGDLAVAGLIFELRQAPGHTPGSTLLVLGATDPDPVVFTGDVIFAGSIGRTDFLVGDPAAMRRSLTTQVLSLPDAARLLPGHGPATELGREREHNPYL
jgi:glyoxylase-like metal-dependent hydrolase (beta-lactamase superfamily II)